jgi:hypothetical protein
LPASQGFYVCWLAVRDVASAYLKYPTSRDMLGVVLRNSVEQKLTRSQAERWSLRRFNRHSHCSESALASVFAWGTRLHNAYLDEVPSLNLLESTWANRDSWVPRDKLLNVALEDFLKRPIVLQYFEDVCRWNHFTRDNTTARTLKDIDRTIIVHNAHGISNNIEVESVR